MLSKLSITRGSHAVSRLWVMMISAVLTTGTPSMARAHLQCVSYARQLSGIAIHGNAKTWWDHARGTYERGTEPKVGAVLAFEATSAMPLGHVAVVAAVLDDRRILLNHANWSGPGMIEEHALAVDVSDAGNGSNVRVWYGPSKALGSRNNPTSGFIYAAEAADRTVIGQASEGAEIDAG